MNGKVILLIMLYRLLEGSGERLYTVKAQMDYRKSKVKPAKKYWEEIIEGLIEFIEQQEGINNIIIAGDLNEDINSNRIRNLLIEKRLFDIYSIINNEDNSKRKSTYLYSSKCIDIITTTASLL